MSKKVVLIYPPIVWGEKQRYGLPPLGMLYIASFLGGHDFEISVIDGTIEGLTMEAMERAILKERPDIVGISGMTPHIPNILDLVGRIKNADDSIKTCLGGSHFNSTKGEIFKFTSDVDFVIYGEGEHTLLHLLESLDTGNYAGVKGLIYRDNGQIKVNEPRPLIKNLDSLPFPDLDLVDVNRYKVPHGEHKIATSMMATRGCPYNCLFCDVYITHGRALRSRSPGNVADEIEHNYQRYGIKEYIMKDSTFTINQKWVLNVCREIRERDLDISWTCNTRVDKVNERLLREMKKSGCRLISFGVESGSQEVLDNIRKGVTIKQIKDAFRATEKVGIETQAFFMVGNPGDNPENVRKTIELAKKLNPHYVSFVATIAYPGTDIFNYALKNRLLRDPHWYIREESDVFLFSVYSAGQLDLEDLGPKEQVEMIKEAYKEFYFRPAYALKMMRKLRNPRFFKNALNSVPTLLSFIYRSG